MSSSSDTPLCVVELASPEDVSNVIKIVAATRTSFAIKSGGHASNPGFSSTTGVFISLVRLNQVVLFEDNSTVEIGTGNIWTDVYTALDCSGFNVVGGRVPGPGVGGVFLGGGYCWLSEQHGLTCDNAITFNLVLPDSTIVQVGSTTPDLFFALKGGLNRFGIVTSIILKAVPQPNLVYGNSETYDVAAISSLIDATATFQTMNTDPKAQLILTINGGVAPETILLLLYGGPDRPAAFDPFNNVIIPPILTTVATQSFASFISAIPSEVEADNRGAFATMMTTSLTPAFMEAIYNQSIYYSTFALINTGSLISYDIEPFRAYGQYATDSAFPRADSPLPLDLTFLWTLEDDDTFWRAEMQASVDILTQVAIDEGIFTEGAYPNYALSTYSGEQLYGAANAEMLRSIQQEYDPSGVMELAGRFSF